ncbi:MAG: hypothetical protein C4548_05305 [Desulfobacteraceae bacterium]|jgi:tetratricopeptide (TPR) repeat protein|nr:MAG: hypothetical protein C4548_05305 [Desulfobacteraceae bacterium]
MTLIQRGVGTRQRFAGRWVQRSLTLTCLLCFVLLPGIVPPAHPLVPEVESSANKQAGQYSGTTACRECHATFYSLWETSHHAKAMQPFSADLVVSETISGPAEIHIGAYRYRVDVSAGMVYEKGPDGDKQYPIIHAIGGKNIYYFLTLMERGRLQTLPVAYDVHEKKWFDMAENGVRHFPDSASDKPISWKDWPYTFNTACYSCHVSQLDTNYDLKTDTYSTRWAEPGINCETCHGPCDEHIRVCRQAPKDTVPEDLKIIRGGRDFTAEQNNDACAGCHAKAIPLTKEFMPGNRFFDHFDLVTLECIDYYADGRDLGENYTLTSWLLSPCVKSGELNCLHCHTSSGRYRHKNAPNQSCATCHPKKVENAAAHTFHKPDSPGSRCINCHMPMTSFARMRRSDHSMLPPTPSATIAFESPNACNLCHDDKDAAWADAWVRQWRKRDYQAPLVQRAELIDAARRQDWSMLPGMLSYINSKDRDAVFAASLIRLLRTCPDPDIGPVLLDAAKDPSPLVRSSAVESLGRLWSEHAGDVLLTDVLLAATGDNVRLVRIKAAAALAGYTGPARREADGASVDRATREYLTTMKTRPDQWTSHYNLGNFYLNAGNFPSALSAYQIAMRLEPCAVMPMVNAAMAHARFGETSKAEEWLKRALDVSPLNATANFNMGLLKAEQKKTAEAEMHLRSAVQAEPAMHEAMFNLGVLLAEKNPGESIDLLFSAFEMNPDRRYAYTLAFYLYQNNDFERAEQLLRFMIERLPPHADSYLLLVDIYHRRNKKPEAIQILNDALSTKGIKAQDRFRVSAKLRELQNNP